MIFVSLSSSASVEDNFFRNQDLSRAILNPSGTLVLLKKTPYSDEKLILQDTVTGKRHTITSNSTSSGYLIANITWVDDNTIAFNKIHAHLGATLFVYDIEHDSDNELTSSKVDEMDYVYIKNGLPLQQNKLIINRYKSERWQLFKYQIGKSKNPQFRSKHSLSKGPIEDANWLINKDGSVNFNFGSLDNKNQMYFKADDNKTYMLLWEGNIKEKIHPVLYLKEQQIVWVLSNIGSNYTHLRQFDIKSKTLGPIVHQAPSKDIDGAIIDRFDNKLIGYSYLQGGVYKRVYFDKYKDKSIEVALTSSNNYIVSTSLDKKTLVYISGSVDKPAKFYLSKQDKTILLGDSRPWLNELSLGESKVIKSISSDGTVIESYLTLPNKDKTKVDKAPLIVMPHGGPIGIQDNRHFSEIIHYFSYQGYAVLTPNYRGSSGYGKSFLSSGKKQWGRLIEDDIESAVIAAISQGAIDDNKLCIFGISYGGYSALASVMRYPERYRCAISYAGVTDLPLLFSQSAKGDESEKKKVLSEIVGDIDTEWNDLIKYSPAYSADKINTPLLLAQGGKDRIVDDEHYFRMILALDHFDKRYEKYYLPDEIHGFRFIDNQSKFFKRVLRFIEKHIEYKKPE
jgi:pimeloyl-ACP methyl ester carboxylesterase